MKSIRWKLVVMYIALVLIVMICVGSFIIITIRGTRERESKESLINTASKVEEQIINVYDTPEDFQSAFLHWNQKANIINKDRKIVASSEVSDISSMVPYTQSVITSALAKEAKFESGRKYIDYASGKETVWMEYARPTYNDKNELEYVIYVRMDAQSIYDDIARTTNIIFWAVILAMFLSGILGILFSSTLTGPIVLITAKAKELAQGNLNQELEVQSNDEIGQLTESFNHMAKELSHSMAKMENEKNKLEIILYNMTDGVLAYDNNGTLIHANQVSKDLLDFSNIENITYNEMTKMLNSDEKEDNTIIKNEFKEIAFYISDKYINASFNPYTNKNGTLEGVVVVFQDITRHKKLDNMRKEFVANVSHEIRTPLTTIKSYTETLIDGAIEEKEIAYEFLGIINNESDRMTVIVKDLLELSKLDNNQMVLNMSKCDLLNILQQSIISHKLTAEKENKEIIFEKPDYKMFVYIDESRITQVLGNIISNSIKYSLEKAKIKIYIRENNDFYNVYIQDNGLGIPKSDLERIFERFYRVDKARSRAMGGTGLGLSIAKEIMEAHDGKISAQSEINKGTTMILEFPKYEKSFVNQK